MFDNRCNNQHEKHTASSGKWLIKGSEETTLLNLIVFAVCQGDVCVTYIDESCSCSYSYSYSGSCSCTAHIPAFTSAPASNPTPTPATASTPTPAPDPACIPSISGLSDAHEIVQVVKSSLWQLVWDTPDVAGFGESPLDVEEQS